VIDAQTQALLEAIVRRESRSLLQYVGEAFPWATREEQAALAGLQTLIEEERQGVATLMQFLVRRGHVYPYLGQYPESFTSINFVALEHLLPLLAEHERRTLADLESDLGRMPDAEARQQVHNYLETKRRHLKALEELAATRPATAGR
jgi:hypothetical protein